MIFSTLENHPLARIWDVLGRDPAAVTSLADALQQARPKAVERARHEGRIDGKYQCPICGMSTVTERRAEDCCQSPLAHLESWKEDIAERITACGYNPRNKVPIQRARLKQAMREWAHAHGLRSILAVCRAANMANFPLKNRIELSAWFALTDLCGTLDGMPQALDGIVIKGAGKTWSELKVPVFPEPKKEVATTPKSDTAES